MRPLCAIPCGRPHGLSVGYPMGVTWAPEGSLPWESTTGHREAPRVAPRWPREPRLAEPRMRILDAWQVDETLQTPYDTFVEVEGEGGAAFDRPPAFLYTLQVESDWNPMRLHGPSSWPGLHLICISSASHLHLICISSASHRCDRCMAGRRLWCACFMRGVVRGELLPHAAHRLVCEPCKRQGQN